MKVYFQCTQASCTQVVHFINCEAIRRCCNRPNNQEARHISQQRPHRESWIAWRRCEFELWRKRKQLRVALVTRYAQRSHDQATNGQKINQNNSDNHIELNCANSWIAAHKRQIVQSGRLNLNAQNGTRVVWSSALLGKLSIDAIKQEKSKWCNGW